MRWAGPGSSTPWQLNPELNFLWVWVLLGIIGLWLTHFLGLRQAWQKLDFRVGSHRGRHQVTAGENYSLKTIILKLNAQDIDHYGG